VIWGIPQAEVIEVALAENADVKVMRGPNSNTSDPPSFTKVVDFEREDSKVSSRSHVSLVVSSGVRVVPGLRRML